MKLTANEAVRDIMRSQMAQLARNVALNDALLARLPPVRPPTVWQRITYYAWRKWWYAYRDWLHRDCDVY